MGQQSLLNYNSSLCSHTIQVHGWDDSYALNGLVNSSYGNRTVGKAGEAYISILVLLKSVYFSFVEVMKQTANLWLLNFFS